MDDISLHQYISWHSQTKVAKEIGTSRQRVWKMLAENREAGETGDQWRVKIGKDRRITGYYKLKRV